MPMRRRASNWANRSLGVDITQPVVPRVAAAALELHLPGGQVQLIACTTRISSGWTLEKPCERGH